MADSANVGYASLQVIPTVAGISGNLTRQLGLPFQRAGQQAGQNAGRAIADGVEAAAARVRAASDKVAKARETEIAASAKVGIAEAKLQELRDRGITGGSRWLAAEENLRRARSASVTATDRARRAAEDLTQAQEDAANATDDVTDSAEGGGSALGGLGDKVKDLVGNFKVAALGAAGLGAAITAGIASNMDTEVINDKLAASLGAGPAEAAHYGKVTADIYRANFGDSMEQVSDSVGIVVASFKNLADTGKGSLTGVTETAINFSKTFGTEVEESVQTVSTLMSTGLVKDANQGFDLMTTAFQKVPAAMRGELPEILHEYGTNFQALGFSGEQAFSMLVTAAGKGKFALDKTGDALKEFTIRGSDMSKASTDAYKAIGLDAEEMSRKVASGGPAAQEALQATAKGLLGIQDPATRANTAIALFGTPLEDLSVDQIPAFLEGLTGGQNNMAGFAGSAERMGNTLNDNTTAKVEAFKRSLQGGLNDAIGQGVTGLMALTGWVKDNGVAVGITAGILGVVLAPALITAAVGWAQTGIAATRSAAAQLAASYRTVGGWIAMSASAVANAATTSGAWIASGARAAGAWIALKAQAVGSFIATAAGATANAAVTTGAWVASGARSAGAWAAMKLAAVGSFIATGASAVVQSAITAGAWVASQGRMALSIGIATAAFIAQKVATVAGTVATGALTVAQWALNAAMSANPIGLVIAIVVALVAAIVLAYRNSETFRNIVQAAWQGIQVAASFAWNSILKPALDGLLAALGWVGDKAMWLWQNVMIPAWDAIKNAISAVWNFIRPILDNIGKGIHAVGEIAAKVGDAMRNAFNGVVDVLKTPIHAVGKLLASIPDKVLGISIPGASAINSWGETLQSLRVGGVVNNGMAGRTRNGVLWGPGSGTDDAILGVDAYGMPTALVSNKEGVVTADAMGHGGAGVVAALNRGWRPTPAQLQGLGLPAYADGGQVGEPYGLPTGSNISYGAPGFPDWVTKLGDQHKVKPSTYAGHQESDRNEAGYAPNPAHQNRGIDWSGPVEAMDAFARYLLGIAPDTPALEQIIWQNPGTGEKVGWHGRTPDAGFSYFAADYGGHTDHVHTRQSAAFGGAAKPKIPDTQVPGYVPPTGLNPDGTTPDTNSLGTNNTTPTTPSTTPQAETKRLKTFKELGSDLGGILFGGVEEFFGDSVPAWVWDANKLTEGADDGSNVRTSDNKGTTGNTTAPSTTTPTPGTTGDQTPPGTTGDQTPPSTTGVFAPDTPDTLKGPAGAPVIKYNPGAGAEQWTPLAEWAINYVNKSLKGPAQTAAMIGQTSDESGGNPRAVNNSDINAQNGTPSGGLLQVIEPTFQANRDPRLPNDKFDPAANYVAALRYYAPKYGQDLTTRWGRGKGGYRAGGYTGNMDPAHIAGVVHGREFVVKSPFAQKNRAILEAMNSGADMGDLLVKSHQPGVGRISAVEQNARRDGGGNKLADVVNIQGYTAEEISSEWNRYQWARTAGYGTSRNR